MILFVLQNAYMSDKHRFLNREEWSRELQRSHSGKRLSEMIPDEEEYAVINSSPRIGDNADSCFVGDSAYVLEWVEKLSPDVICACGKVAQDTCNKAKLLFISLPHPAWRALSKETTRFIKALLRGALTATRNYDIMGQIQK